MYIKSYSFDGENEASVVVTDGKFELICYAYPFNKKIKKFWEEHRKPADDAETGCTGGSLSGALPGGRADRSEQDLFL